MTSNRVRGLVLAGLVAAGALVQAPARAHRAEPLIQPGAAAYPAHTPLGPWSPCTLNFVFRDAHDVYIGAAARCTYEVGERVVMDGREFGTVVFRAFTGSEEPHESVPNQQFVDDFALIRVDRSERDRVSPVVLGANRSPAGFTASGDTADGYPVFMSGQGVGLSGEATRVRPGLLLFDDRQGFRAEFAMSAGDSGAPVMYEDLALGVLSAQGVPGAFGTTVERILALLRRAGFRVELVTAWP